MRILYRPVIHTMFVHKNMYWSVVWVRFGTEESDETRRYLWKSSRALQLLQCSWQGYFYQPCQWHWERKLQKLQSFWKRALCSWSLWQDCRQQQSYRWIIDVRTGLYLQDRRFAEPVTVRSGPAALRLTCARDKRRRDSICHPCLFFRCTAS